MCSTDTVLLHSDAIRLIRKLWEFKWWTIGPKVSNSCQCRGAHGEYQWDFVDTVTTKGQRQTCCPCGNTSLRLRPTGGLCLISAGSTVTCVSIHPMTDERTGLFKKAPCKSMLVLWWETTIHSSVSTQNQRKTKRFSVNRGQSKRQDPFKRITRCKRGLGVEVILKTFLGRIKGSVDKGGWTRR